MSLELNCANIFDNGKGMNFPLENARKYPMNVRSKGLTKYIENGGEILVIPVEGKALEQKEEQEVEQKVEQEVEQEV